MKRLALGIALFISLAFTATLAYAGSQDFVLHNETGVVIHELYISPADTENWEDNLIEGHVIEADGSLTVNFSGDDSIQLWDIMVKDSEGNGIYWRDIDLIKASEITLQDGGVASIK